MATATQSSYSAADIEVLEGLEAVRRRPSMYIGGVDNRGLHHLLWEVVDNSVDEFLAGHADTIKVVLHKDGASLTITDNGRGIPVDKHPKYKKKSALEVILTTLHAGGKFSDKSYARSGGLHGVGSSVVNALSEEMVATIHRDGFEWVQRYKRGRPTTPLKKVKPFKGRGTVIFFRPDTEIFRKTSYNHDTIRQHLEDISYIHAGLRIRFIDEPRNETHDLYQPEGIKAYLEKLTKDENKNPVHETIFSAEKDDGKLKTELVLRWTEAPDEQLRSYVNGIRTHAGGTHLNGVRSAIVKAIKNYMEVHSIKPKGITLTADDIREGLLGVVSIFLGDPMFQGQTKEKLNNPEITSQVEGFVRPAIENWLNSNATITDAILGRIILSARARQASRDAVLQVKRKTPGSRKNNLPGKLLDCRSNNAEESELFIVEGDSAGGTAASGRDSRVQAILPLRGKILNTESLKIGKALQNQEIQDLVETLGTGIGPEFDIRKLRYNRIILLMDADADGYHISTLMLAFFFRHMPEIIRQGKLYIGQPPLYRITIGSKNLYALDDRHKEEILASIPANRKVEIGRFKGLGEMNASQLKETTLDPKQRVLLKVEVENQVEADETFHQLLGKDASERYRIIMSESALADDLDV